MPSRTRSGRRRFFSHAAATLGGTAFFPALEAADGQTRPDRVYNLRQRRAEAMRSRPVPAVVTNGDEQRYSNKINSFSKTLRKTVIGEVEPASYASMIAACESGRFSDFEAIQRGGGVRLKNPAGAFGLQYAGLDQSQFAIPAAPSLAPQHTSVGFTISMTRRICCC